MDNVTYSPFQIQLAEEDLRNTQYYREIAPIPELRQFIACYWVISYYPKPDTKTPYINRVLPDGCIDIILELSSSILTSNLVGLMKNHIVLELTEPAEYLGIRFMPGAAKLLFKNPISEFTDCSINLSDLLGTGIVELEYMLHQTTELGKRIKILNLFLKKCFLDVYPKYDLISFMLDNIYKSRGNITINDLANITFMSTRTLCRFFDNWVGTGPKSFCRIVRFQNILREINNRKDINTIELALEYGYYDYSHFAKELKEFSGISLSDLK